LIPKRTHCSEEKNAFEEGFKKALYFRYPEFREAMGGVNAEYNMCIDELAANEKAGKIFMLAPHEKVEIGKFEGDMEKLGRLYKRGYEETKEEMPRLREYLNA